MTTRSSSTTWAVTSGCLLATPSVTVSHLPQQIRSCHTVTDKSWETGVIYHRTTDTILSHHNRQVMRNRSRPGDEKLHTKRDMEHILFQCPRPVNVWAVWTLWCCVCHLIHSALDINSYFQTQLCLNLGPGQAKHMLFFFKKPTKCMCSSLDPKYVFFCVFILLQVVDILTC